MHEQFPDWYQVADPNASRETITKRWAATEEHLASVTQEKVAELAGYITRSQIEEPEWFQKVYKKHDDVMLTRNVGAELRVLAGIVLRITLENGDEDEAETEEEGREVSISAALALLVGAFGMKEEPKWLREHLVAAARQLSRTGHAMREVTADFSVDSPLTAEGVNDALRAVQTRMDAVTEENNYLWWAFVKRSQLLNDEYAKLTPSVVALAASVEIFALVRWVPAAAETETLLLHVLLSTPGGSDTDLSFKNYFTGLGRERAQRLSRPVPPACTTLCPIMSAISAVAEGKKWLADFEKMFGIKTTTSFPPHSVALQLFRELCLSRLFVPEE